MINAPVSGIFSQTLDGFEHVSPLDLNDITPSRLGELFASSVNVSGAGKLVTDFKWYFAATMSLEDVIPLSAGRQMPIQFSGAYTAKLDMLVERVGRREDGMCVVLFLSDRNIGDIAPLRELSADIVYNVVSGIRIPKEAVHLDNDGTTYVFLQTGARAERVDIEILLEAGDNYLVRDGIEAGTPLRAGSTIIVKANNLFDGKLVA